MASAASRGSMAVFAIVRTMLEERGTRLSRTKARDEWKHQKPLSPVADLSQGTSFSGLAIFTLVTGYMFPRGSAVALVERELRSENAV
jgi:hypothetical protein